MRNGWVEDLLSGPVDRITALTAHAEWTAMHGGAGSDETVHGKARIALYSAAAGRLVGVTISRRGRIRMRGLFITSDVVVQSRSGDHIGLAIATGPDHTVSLLRLDTPNGNRIADFLTD